MQPTNEHRARCYTLILPQHPDKTRAFIRETSALDPFTREGASATSDTAFEFVKLSVADAKIPVKQLSHGCKCLLAYLQARAGKQGVWGNRDKDDATKQRIGEELGVNAETIHKRLKVLVRLGRVRYTPIKRNSAGLLQYEFHVQPVAEGAQFFPLDVNLLRYPPSIVSDGEKIARGLFEFRSDFRGDSYRDAFPGYSDIAKRIGCERRNAIKIVAGVQKKLSVSRERRRRSSNIWKVEPLSICDSLCMLPENYFIDASKRDTDDSALQELTSGESAFQELAIVHSKVPAIVHPEESITEESIFLRHPDIDVDLDSPAENHKNRDSQPVSMVDDLVKRIEEKIAKYQPVKETIEKLSSKTANDKDLVEICDCAAGWSVEEIVECFVLSARISPEPPQSVDWFASVIRNEVAARRAIPPPPSYAALPKLGDRAVDDLASAFDPLSDVIERQEPILLQDEYLIPASFDYTAAMLKFYLEYPCESDEESDGCDDDRLAFEERDLILCLHQVPNDREAAFWADWDRLRYEPSEIAKAQRNFPKLLNAVEDYRVEMQILDNWIPRSDFLRDPLVLIREPRTEKEIYADLQLGDDDELEYEFPYVEKFREFLSQCPGAPMHPADVDAPDGVFRAFKLAVHAMTPDQWEEFCTIDQGFANDLDVVEEAERMFDFIVWSIETRQMGYGGGTIPLPPLVQFLSDCVLAEPLYSAGSSEENDDDQLRKGVGSQLATNERRSA